MKINFLPESDDPKLIAAAKEYTDIWQKEGKKIIKTIEDITKLSFKEKEINSLIFEGMSHSHPMCLRASYDIETKKGTLVHELCHRLLVGNKVRLPMRQEPQVLLAHRVVDLVLYDILVELYGEEFAKKNIEVESTRSREYAQAWQWAMSMSKEERQDQFKELSQPL
jgi:hypothetical protein